MAVPQSFPAKVYQILECESREIICWNDNGMSFRILDHSRFEREIVPKYFRHNQISSVQRQLNLYGFKCISRGELKRSFFHPKFKRGDWETVKKLTRYVPPKRNCPAEDEARKVESLPPRAEEPSAPAPAPTAERDLLDELNMWPEIWDQNDAFFSLFEGVPAHVHTAPLTAVGLQLNSANHALAPQLQQRMLPRPAHLAHGQPQGALHGQQGQAQSHAQSHAQRNALSHAHVQSHASHVQTQVTQVHSHVHVASQGQGTSSDQPSKPSELATRLGFGFKNPLVKQEDVNVGPSATVGMGMGRASDESDSSVSSIMESVADSQNPSPKPAPVQYTHTCTAHGTVRINPDFDILQEFGVFDSAPTQAHTQNVQPFKSAGPTKSSRDAGCNTLLTFSKDHNCLVYSSADL
mmetsp:Transcript_19267/g.42953  ORF Transcript_19267/g.42953 Transcript_19267/m.42953 type:complete len:408 (-) Transcript_19267:23-1246(-)